MDQEVLEKMEDLLEFQWQRTQDLKGTTHSGMQVKVTSIVTVSYDGFQTSSKQALTRLEQISSMTLNGLEPLGLKSVGINTTYKSQNHSSTRKEKKDIA